MRLGRLALQFVAASSMTLSCSGAAVAQPGFEDTPAHSRVSIVSESKTIAPDTTTMLALVFDLDETYHTYAHSYNDSGAPLIASWSLPEGVEIGEPIWPAPHRYEQAGDVLDHVYEDQLFLMMPVSIDPSTPIGTELKISADLEWLVCDDRACVPQFGKVRTKLTVANDVEPGPDADAFHKAREQSPRLLTGARDDAVKVMWEGDTLVLSNMLGYAMSFIPEGDSAKPMNLLETGHSDEGVLRLQFDDEHADRVVGWVWLHEIEGNTIAPVRTKLWMLNVRRGEKPALILSETESEGQ